MKRNVSEHLYEDASDEQDTFEIYQTDKGWFWSFSPIWRDAGPFRTEEEAFTAGEKFLDENGEPFIKY